MRYRSYRLPRGSTSPDLATPTYWYTSLQQTAQTAGDGGFHGFSRNVRRWCLLLNQIANFMARLEQAVCRGTQNALCRVTDHTGNARIRQRRTVYSTWVQQSARAWSQPPRQSTPAEAWTDRNDDRRVCDVRTEVLFARIASTKASGVAPAHFCRRIGQHRNDAPCSVSAASAAVFGVHARSTTVSPNRIASEKHTVIGGSTLAAQICQHQTNARTVQPQGNPRGNALHRVSRLTWRFLRLFVVFVTIATDDYSARSRSQYFFCGRHDIILI